MDTIRLVSFFSLALLVMTLLGTPDALAGTGCKDSFSTQYPGSQTEDLGNCQTCHQSPSGGGNYNVYGADLRSNGAAGAGFNCANVDFAAVLVAVETLDSDAEGNTNVDEILADTQPGWCDATQSATCSNSAGTPPAVTLDPDPQPPGNSKPVAHAGGPYAGEAGNTLIQFDGSASSDADGDQLNFAWSFGDGATDIGMMPTHTYTMPGNFEVSLVVNDGAVNSDPNLTTAAITAPPVNLAPSADAGGPYEGRPGQPVVFDASASADPNGDALSYAWQFGDGATGTGVAPTHTYAAEGTYVVSLTVNDGGLDSAVATSSATITTPVVQTDGEALYNANCLGCHGDPWAGSAVDAALAGQRRVAGARSCNLTGSIFGTSVFPNGVPEMQFLQGLANEEIDEIANYLNSQVTSGERRYITTCAGCHGNDGSGGRVGEDVYGDSAGETWEAIGEESEMNYMACMPRSDINDIVDFLKASGSGADDDDDDEDDDDEGGGSTDLPLLVLLAGVALLGRIGRQLRRAPAS